MSKPTFAVIDSGESTRETFAKMLKALEELEQYRKIGTVKEFKELYDKEISVSREIRHGDYFCPKCGSHVDYKGYCHACGQKVY